MSGAADGTIAEVAVFDFDGTLTSRDSLMPFLRLAVPPRRLWPGLLSTGPLLAGHRLGLVANWVAKQAVLERLLCGMEAATLDELGHRFAAERIPQLLRPGALDRLELHRRHGHLLILVSASLETYLAPWGRLAGFDHVLATRLETRDGRVTGRIMGRNCHGPEKVARLTALLGESLNGRVVHAYGDSRGDRELLALAQYPHYRALG